MNTIRCWLLFGLLFLALGGCAPPCRDDPACTRVLFVGNSLTHVNDLPKTFTKLAKSGTYRVETGMAAPGGWGLSDHIKATETLAQIQSSKWNFVVLQDHSQIPASEPARTEQMFPAARALAAKVKEFGAIPMLFVTWAHRDGWQKKGLLTYESMQLQIDSGYMAIGQELKARIAPVGYAWLTMRQENPQMVLWQADGLHPNEQGTYLAACVFYAAIFHQSPEGLTYTGNLSKESAGVLQHVAAETVLTNSQKWNLP